MDFYSNKKLDLLKISNLFEDSFGQKFNSDYWKWRFLSNPNSLDSLISYLEEEDFLTAYYAVSPMTINIGETQYKVALSNMTMTHPNHQGRGYFKKLANSLYDKLKSEVYIGIYGFANQNSHYGFRKYLNWNDLAVLNNFTVKAIEFRGSLVSKDFNVTYSIEPISLETLKRVAGYSYSETGISISRDYSNLKWRFLDNPSNHYYSLSINIDTIEVLVIFKKYLNSIDIMEVFYNTQDIDLKNTYLMLGFNHFLSKNYDKINIWSNLYSKEHLTLEKHGFKKEGFSTYFGFIPFTTDHKEVLDIKNWHYRFCDSDVY